MKKSPKLVSPQRKLIIEREVIAQLKPLQLAQAVGGNDIIQSAPLCSQK